jgi:hypothetical protein
VLLQLPRLAQRLLPQVLLLQPVLRFLQARPEQRTLQQ